jgi:hypothetical protein
LSEITGLSGKQVGFEPQFGPSRFSLDAENSNLTALLSTGMEEFYHPQRA